VAGTLFVRQKVKDKDKDKDKDKEFKDKDKDFREKVFKDKDAEKFALAEKVSDVLAPPLGRIASSAASAQVPDGTGQRAPVARAFIRPEERPEVGQALLGQVKREKDV